MEKELSYLTNEGHTVFTSYYLKKRGTCCKSACLHCPYGYTLKKLGLQFQTVEEKDFSLVETILSECGGAEMAFKSFWPENIRFILLKNQVCGLFLKNHLVIKHLYLLPHFRHQDLSKELIESYFFN